MRAASLPRAGTPESGERAALVGLFNGTHRQFDPEHSLDELAGLPAAAGATVVLRVLQDRPRPDPATFLGSGKVDSLAAAATKPAPTSSSSTTSSRRRSSATSRRRSTARSSTARS